MIIANVFAPILVRRRENCGGLGAGALSDSKYGEGMRCHEDCVCLIRTLDGKEKIGLMIASIARTSFTKPRPIEWSANGSAPLFAIEWRFGFDRSVARGNFARIEFLVAQEIEH